MVGPERFELSANRVRTDYSDQTELRTHVVIGYFSRNSCAVRQVLSRYSDLLLFTESFGDKSRIGTRAHPQPVTKTGVFTGPFALRDVVGTALETMLFPLTYHQHLWSLIPPPVTHLGCLFQRIS